MGLVGRKGKLSISDIEADVRDVAWERYEDVLTADVFGAYRYLPPDLGFVPLLEHAVDESGLAFSQYLRSYGIELPGLNVLRLRFWPTFNNGCEPDVFALLESTNHNQSVALLIEAKLHASQHQIEGHSQLGHYLMQHLTDAYADGSLAWNLPEQPRPLLFITNHKDIPATELVRAKEEVAAEIPDIEPKDVGLFWVNWAVVGLEAKRLWRKHRDEVDSAPWLRHLLDLYEEIRDRDLLPRPPFAGISPLPTGRLPRSYARTYAKGLPESSLPGPIVLGQYIRASLASVFDDEGRYTRSYQTQVIQSGCLPSICAQNLGKSHDR